MDATQLNRRGSLGEIRAGSGAHPSSAIYGEGRRKTSHRFELADGQLIQGLVIGEGEQQRVYVNTPEPPPGLEWAHDRWPLIQRPATNG